MLPLPASATRPAAAVLAGTVAGAAAFALGTSVLLPGLTRWPLVALSGGAAALVAAAVASGAAGRANRPPAREEAEFDVARDSVLFDSSPRPMWVYDVETLAFLAVNDAAVEEYGYGRDEFLARTIRDIRPPEYLPLLDQQLASAATRYHAATGTRHRTKAGTLRDVEIASHPVTWAGRAARLVLVYDVTAQRAAFAAARDSEARLRLALDAAHMVVWEQELEGGRVALTGPAGERRRPAERVSGADDSYAAFLAAVHPEDRARMEATRARVLADPGRSHDVEFRVREPGGRTGWRRATGRLVRDDTGRPVRIVGVSADVTAQRRAAEEAHDRATQLRLMVEQLPAVMWSTDTELRFTSSMGAGLARLGVAPGQLNGVPFQTWFETNDPAFPPTAAARRALEGHSTAFEVTLRGRAFQAYVEPLRDAAGHITGSMGLAIDVSDRKELEARLAHQAFHDALTGLANRALFRDRVEHALARAHSGREAVGTEHVAVLFLDLDDFKTVNDSLGHGEGDRLLQRVADRLRRATRGFDTVARLGGDEFAVLLEGLAAHEDALIVIERVQRALAAPSSRGASGEVAEPDARAYASLGLAYADPGCTADDLLRNADTAMYAAKAAGKGRSAVFEPSMHRAVVARRLLERDLRDALEDPDRPGLSLAYQPTVELATGRVVSFEALFRWRHEERGVVSPAECIPVAEESGLIVPLGAWVLDEACRQLARWSAHPEVSVAVNVSGRQLEDPAFVGTVAAALEATGVPAARLTLEVTETAVMRDTTRTVAALHALKALGVGLALDDFGTGYSSLSYLQQFPVDVLKIDKRFVDGVARGGGDAALARTIVALGQTLGLRTVAEGVETVAQRDALAGFGCALGQGYLFARPLPAAEAAALLDQPLAGGVLPDGGAAATLGARAAASAASFPPLSHR